MDRQRDVFPFWQYQSADDERVRDTHAALDGKVFPANSSFWQSHYPPWEFGCRCFVTPLSEDDVADLEKADAKKPPEARRVVKGANLEMAEKSGVLYSVAEGGVPRQLDVRSPREKFGGSGFYHNPGDLHLDFDGLQARYADTPEIWKTFESWSQGTSLGKGRGSVGIGSSASSRPRRRRTAGPIWKNSRKSARWAARRARCSSSRRTAAGSS